MSLIESVNWSIFEEEQGKVIKGLIESGEWDKMALAIEIHNEKQEQELHRIVSSMRPKIVVNESKVAEELREKEMKEGFKIETPEQEKEWQEKFEAEKQKQKKEFEQEHGVLNEEKNHTIQKEIIPQVELEEEMKRKPGRPKKEEVIPKIE